MLEHQKRVETERDELYEKLQKLSNFLHDGEAKKVCISQVEHDRMSRQEMIMKLYVHILTERIQAFKL